MVALITRSHNSTQQSLHPYTSLMTLYYSVLYCVSSDRENCTNGVFQEVPGNVVPTSPLLKQITGLSDMTGYVVVVRTNR